MRLLVWKYLVQWCNYFFKCLELEQVVMGCVQVVVLVEDMDVWQGLFGEWIQVVFFDEGQGQ